MLQTLYHFFIITFVILYSNLYAMEPATAFSLCEQAQKLRHTSNCNIEQVRSLYEQALEICNDDFERARCHQGLAKTFYHTDAQKTKECFDKAISYAPYLVDLYFEAGDYCAFELKNYEKAVVYFNLGRSKCSEKQRDKLVRFFRSYGKMLRDQNELKKAEQIYTEGLSFCTRNVPQKRYIFYRLLGVIKSMLGGHQVAHSMFCKALENNDFSDFNGTLETFQYVAESYAKTGHEKHASIKFNECREYISKTKQLPLNATSLPIFYHAWAQFYVSLGRKDDALKILQEYFDRFSTLYTYDLNDIYTLFATLTEQAKCSDSSLNQF